MLKWAFEGKLTAQWREEQKQQGKLESAEILLEQIKAEREQRYQAELAQWQAEVEAWEATGKVGKKPGKPKKLEDVQPLTETELSGQNYPKLPVEWRLYKIESLCEVVRGGSPRPAGNPQFYGGSIPFLKVADITHGNSVYLRNYTFTIKEAGLQKTRAVKAPTLLLSNSGATLGVPKICMVDATFNDGIAAFLGLNPRALLYHYYFWVSQTESLRAIDQGAAQPNLNTTLIGQVAIPICSIDEQEEIVRCIESRLSICDSLETAIADNLQRAEALRQSILKQAFEGKLVPQDPNDEPASVLLERIRISKAAQAEDNKHTKRKQSL